jgi:hypothetical protein
MDGEQGSVKSKSLPSELMGRASRRVRLTGTGWLFALAGAFFIFLATYIAIKIAQEVNKQKATQIALQQSSSRTIGQVTSKRKGLLDYKFEVDGTIYFGRAAAPNNVWDSLHEGDSLSVRYLPATPDISHPAAWEDSPSSTWWALIFPGFLAMMGAGFVWRFPLEYRVAVDGVPAWACIAERDQVGVGTGWWHWESYTFRNSVDEVQFGRCPMVVRFRAGASVCVLYLPKNPTVSHIYPLDFFEIEP